MRRRQKAALWLRADEIRRSVRRVRLRGWSFLSSRRSRIEMSPCSIADDASRLFIANRARVIGVLLMDAALHATSAAGNAPSDVWIPSVDRFKRALQKCTTVRHASHDRSRVDMCIECNARQRAGLCTRSSWTHEPTTFARLSTPESSVS